MTKVLCLLACSENGLSETELMWLLSDSKEEPLPMMLWADCRRLLKPFLRNTGRLGTEEKLDFFHASIQEVTRFPIDGIKNATGTITYSF